jgi:hypothetical protein
MTRRPSAAPLRISRMVRKELRQLFRDPKSKRIIFAAPIIQLLAFGYAVNTDRSGAGQGGGHRRARDPRGVQP